MRIPKIHKLKVWLRYYSEIENHNKTFELRKNDRDFQIRDFLFLQPFDNDKKEEVQMGRELAKITYVLKEAPEFGIMEGYAILGLKFWKDFTYEERLLFRLVELGKIGENTFGKENM